MTERTQTEVVSTLNSSKPNVEIKLERCNTAKDASKTMNTLSKRGGEKVSESHERFVTPEQIANSKIRILREIVRTLQNELETFNHQPEASGQQLDFYTEVSQFEIDLIKRALRFAAGHQGKAARLLNLKTSTLHAMIRRYHADLSHLTIPLDNNDPAGGGLRLVNDAKKTVS